jgi:two-component system, OmpR family, sensor histidine kinase ChvG
LATGSPSASSRRPGPSSGLRLGLRFTLLFALLPLLALPWIGLRFVERMAEMTRDVQAQTQQAAARSLAASLHERHELFGLGDPAQLPRGIQLFEPTVAAADGVVDWPAARRVSLPVQVEGSAPLQTLRVQMAALAVGDGGGGDGRRLLLLVEADDERLVLPGELDTSGDGPVVQPGDQLTVLIGGDETLQQATAADQRARATGSSRVSLPELPQRVPVPLTATPAGWRAEVELPDETRLIRVLVTDVDYMGSRSVEAQADSGVLLLATRSDGLERAAAARRDQQWGDFLRALDRGVGRISVFDSAGQLLAQRGEVLLTPPPAQDWLARVARLLLSLAVRIDPEDRHGAAGAQSPLATALAGVPAESAERAGAQAGMPVWMLGTAHPVWVGGIVAGALLLEDSTVERLSLAQRSLERFTLLVAGALAATVLALLAVGSLAVSRIVRLRRAAEASIDAHGRVRGTVPRFRLRDEVDAMAASYNRLLGRLYEHQDYLARLRSRLVHELRTPIMVVRSSLDNLAAEPDPQRTAAYAQRAQAGAARLERIVASMGEASSLEAMLADSEMESVDLVALVGACLEGYRTAYPGVRLRLDERVAAARCEVAPEAIAQALDKLVGNALDFATPGSEIVVGVGATRANGNRHWRIAVANQGPALPAAMADSLFESMVSVRADTADTADPTGHLGLGLYLVRLIAEFHGGSAYARNIEGGVEVGFTMRADV